MPGKRGDVGRFEFVTAARTVIAHRAALELSLTVGRR